MRIAFTTFESAWPQVCGTQKNASALAAHVLMDTPSGRVRQAARQVRRAAAGFNMSLLRAPSKAATALRSVPAVQDAGARFGSAQEIQS